MDVSEFEELFSKITNFKKNSFHPLVWIVGNPTIGKNVYIGGMSEIQAKDVNVIIQDNCDIASFVSINAADSHKQTISLMDDIERKDIVIENNIFIGSHSLIKGGANIGHHSVVAADLKHFTLDKSSSGQDHWFSFDLSELQEWSNSIKKLLMKVKILKKVIQF